MKARIVDNLMEVIDDFFDSECGHTTDPEFAALNDRIAGKVVDLVFIGSDAFEEKDNNFWLPDCCWDAI